MIKYPMKVGNSVFMIGYSKNDEMRKEK